ncbi:MAG: 4Fe-4S dicluster domain-containing protein [Ruminococcaceae bacterium]|nr:4Fe-4S dicluster domain-containing protein [Oscillospiraceae bacterium]
MRRHSVSLDLEKCKGCTNCLKRCPTEAIRIRGGHAVIKSERCIDCGECIRVCPYRAKLAKCDRLDDFSHYKWKIAIPAPALYGQFAELDDLDYILTGLLQIGFDDVFEVARAAEIVSEYTRHYLHRPDITKPVISSACPAVVRLISVRFPYLLDNVLPILPPVELAARMAKQEAMRRHPNLKEKDICALFISPCPAKVSYARNPIGVEKSAVDGVLSISDIFFRLVPALKKIEVPTVTSRSGIIGISWAGSGGESSALLNDKYLAADGIENVIKVLDEIEKENFAGLEFIELNACSGGCVGGAMNMENPFIAKARLQNLRRYLPVSQNRMHYPGYEGEDDIPEELFWSDTVDYLPIMQLDTDRAEALRKMQRMQQIDDTLPNLDCGSCGAPSCSALAEDIVRGEADESDCVIRMRQQIEDIWRTMGRMVHEGD